jgi:hypothetical protein
MSNQNQYQLINYLDRTLTEQEMREVEALIQTDNEANQQWQYLEMAVQAVEYAALYEQVASVKEEYKASLNVQAMPAVKGKVRRIPSTTLRIFQIAATLVLLCMAMAVYKYMTTSAADVFAAAYLPYELNTSRSGGTINELEQAYRNKNWQAVIIAYNKLTEKNNKARFLAGMAHMELTQYAAAAQQFEQVLVQNARVGDDYFQDESEYYLAVSYLALNRIKEAITILEKIKADKTHLFHTQADRIAATDLKIVSFKSDK